MSFFSLFHDLNDNRYFQSIFKINVVVTTLGAIVADVLTPIAPMGLYIALVLGFFFIILLIIRTRPRLEPIAGSCFGQYWEGPVFMSLALSIIMLVYAHHLAETSEQQKGYLATEFKIFEKIQGDVGIIKKQTAEIASNTREIAKDIKEINATIQDLDIKPSHDPREKIAKFGLKWNRNDFANALKSGDIQIIELFLKGGMKATDIHKGSSIVLYAMQPNLNNNPVEILQMLVKYGFDINTILFDPSILTHWNSSLPPYYLADNKPSEYSAYNKKFSGPLLMWTVVLSTYRGATTDDIKIINYLVANNAELEITLSYLDFSKSWLDSTAPYHKIRPLLSR